MLLGWSLAPSVQAATATPTQTTKKVKAIFYCPAIKDIKKNPKILTWSADGGNYKSYDMSFATGLEKFMGAQWVGANVGQITCVYSAKPKMSFPVMLIFHTLTHQPSGGSWGKNLGGYLNCNSFKRKTCPFKMVLKPKAENIYKEAEKLKSNAPDSEPPTE